MKLIQTVRWGSFCSTLMLLAACSQVAVGRGYRLCRGAAARDRRRASRALFNGKDLTGWRGGDTFDHRKLLAMPAERARGANRQVDGNHEGPLAHRERRAGQ